MAKRQWEGDSPEESRKRQCAESTDDEDEDEDDDDEEEPMSPVTGEHKPAEAGIIKFVKVENFMCHQNLMVALNRNVNFVNGSNGSGKSAILAAIQICLGANARRTNRARNLKGLVRKDGQDSPTKAVIQVALLNGGDDAYKSDIYGDTIIVERTISLAGGFNGYKLLNHKGVEKSRIKKDLDEMLDMLNIQVENPISVLDQEEAKKFLCGKAQDKYKFFTKATELERVDRSYSASLDLHDELIEANIRATRELDRDQIKVKELKRKYEQHKQLEIFEKKVLVFRVKHAWAVYKQSNEEYQQALPKKESLLEKTANAEQALAKAQQALDKPDEERLALENRIQELSEESTEQAALKREMEREIVDKEHPRKALDRKLERLLKEKKQVKKGLHQAKQRRDDARQEMLELAGSAKSEEARRALEMQQAEEELEQTQSQSSEMKQSVAAALEEHQKLEPYVQDAKAKVKSVHKQLENGIRIVNALKKSGDEFAMLGPKVKTVYSKVRRVSWGC
jgi:chromosome segregation ATPase